ncbi:MAG: zinc ribbon domain-containing protein [Geodermatophilaceae bacterium]
MQADPFAQLRLLDVQALDSTLSRLEHRRSTLPEAAALEQQTLGLTDLQDAAGRVETELADLGREQRRLEGDVETVRARQERDNTRLTSGAITNARELESLQHELQTLARRQLDLEDQVLALMERREEMEARLAALQVSRTEAEAEVLRLSGARDVALASIEADRAAAVIQRAERSAGLPEDLLKLYDTIRAGAGAGVGAAALRARRCEGCRMDVSGTELSRARTAPPQEVLRCDECRRILVRVADSGL